MSYSFKYTEGLNQLGMIHLMLNLFDSDGILPDVNVPVVLDQSEYYEENLNKIANQLIETYNTPLILDEISLDTVEISEPQVETTE